MDRGTSVSHKIGIILALFPFFIGAAFFQIDRAGGSSIKESQDLMLSWWGIAIGLYVTVRVIGFLLTGPRH